MEAATIVLIATIVGVLYSGVTGKGLFRPTSESPGSAMPEASESAFLTFEEAQSLYNRQGALFIDGRHPYDFGIGHIKGALNIPLEEFETARPFLSSLPRDQMLVTYCDGEECSSSIALAKLLYATGFINVKVFFGGWNEWRKHDQPVDP